MSLKNCFFFQMHLKVYISLLHRWLFWVVNCPKLPKIGRSLFFNGHFDSKIGKFRFSNWSEHQNSNYSLRKIEVVLKPYRTVIFSGPEIIRNKPQVRDFIILEIVFIRYSGFRMFSLRRLCIASVEVVLIRISDCIHSRTS